ncbi:MAG: hypothetical protein Alis3KO_41440 [Aliiglaciecola sp.]
MCGDAVIVCGYVVRCTNGADSSFSKYENKNWEGRLLMPVFEKAKSPPQPKKKKPVQRKKPKALPT